MRDRWPLLLEELYGLAPRGIQPGLDRVREALARIGDPQASFEVVHVAGTNGKGSVSAMIAAGVTDRRVGLYTSPHLHTLTERFRIDGVPTSREVVVDAWDDVRDRLEGVPLTFFEAVTALAFEVFRREGVRLAVLETGLGGRLDATNVFERPLVTAITRVALDHESWLGHDLASIAAEKAGILKGNVSCVVGPQEVVVDAVIDREAVRVGALPIRPRFEGPSHALVVTSSRSSPPLALGLAGDHQHENAAVAVGALFELEANGVAIDPARAVRAEWPGRLERSAGSPNVLFDVAHNPSGAAALAHYLRDVAEPVVLVFGAMRDKAWPEMLSSLRPVASHVVLTAAGLSRSEDPQRMASPGDAVLPDVVDALEHACSMAGPTGLVVVTGSVFVVAAARAHRLGIESDPPIAL